MKGRKRSTGTPFSEDKHLPPDLWRDIFARLPAKTLLKFRTFTDFTFTIRRSDTYRKCNQLGNISNSNMVWESTMIDGLLLMKSKSVSSELSLWNPSIGKSLLLPTCPLTGRSYYRRYHLGYAPLSNDYKVVAFELVDTMFLRSVDMMNSELAFAIYSLRDHRWRVKPKKANFPTWCFETIELTGMAVFFQGVAYWRPRTHRIPGEETQMLCFDFDAEEFSYLEMTDFEEDMLRFLFVFCGSLAFFGISSVRNCIWVMEKNGGENLWRQCFCGGSSLDAYRFMEHNIYGPLRVLYMENDGTLLVLSCNRLASYNIRSNQIQRMPKSVRCVYVGT